jgi:basic membrane protein A
MKKLYMITALVLLASMLLTACGTAATPAPTEAPAPTTAPAATQAPAPTEAPAATTAPAIKVGEVTDLGGVDDKSFNASAWKGVQDAEAQLGVEGKYLESKDQSDYQKNIQQFLTEKDDLIVTVGFLLGVDTATAAKANPDTKFAIVDYTYPDCYPGAVEGKDCGSSTDLSNVRGLAFQTDQAAFLAGYAAAGMSKSGKVGTFGGIKIPTVTIFMKGFEAGVKYYNTQNNKSVEVLGWNTAKDDGLFTGNFDSTDDGRKFAESLMQEGADIIMPVAGPVGLGSAAVCKETGKCWIIGVDNDWYESAAEYKSIILTSVMKKINVAVFNTIQDVKDGKFKGGTVTYTIKDGGVDMAPFHDFDSQVPADLKTQIDTAKKALIDGSLTVDSVLGK